MQILIWYFPFFFSVVVLLSPFHCHGLDAIHWIVFVFRPILVIGHSRVLHNALAFSMRRARRRTNTDKGPKACKHS